MIDVTLIAAVAENGIIGNNGDLPWNIREDLERFRELTLGSTVIMGRKTFDSIIERSGKPLDRRNNVVVSREMDPDLIDFDLDICRNLERAFDIARNYEAPIYVIGGSSIYRQVLEEGLVNRLEITEVKGNFEGDVIFPDIEWDAWLEMKRIEYETHSFVSYRRYY